MTNPKYHTDIVNHGWVEKIPDIFRPYAYLMRLDRPIGTWLLLLPACWAIALSGGGWTIYLLFAIGAFVMRGAGCVINDLWDRDLDGRVGRTAKRPLPSGDISGRQAFVFLAVLLGIGLLVLVQFNGFTIGLGFLSLLFVITYPLMKRITWWPQAFLGLTFNFGVLMGWSAVTGTIESQATYLYISGFFWTLGYDTIYALQDKDDDALIGVRSTARLFVEKWKIHASIPCGLFYAVSIIFMGLAIPNILIVIPALHLFWQLITLKQDDPLNSLKRFKSNRDYGFIVLFVILFLY
jgi:4-hydroxybenzoate polyprenyltransferase